MISTCILFAVHIKKCKLGPGLSRTLAFLSMAASESLSLLKAWWAQPWQDPEAPAYTESSRSLISLLSLSWLLRYRFSINVCWALNIPGKEGSSWPHYHTAWSPLLRLSFWSSSHKSHWSEYPLRITSVQPLLGNRLLLGSRFLWSYNGSRIWIFQWEQLFFVSMPSFPLLRWIQASLINWTDREAEKEGFIEAYSQLIGTTGPDLWLALIPTSPAWHLLKCFLQFSSFGVYNVKVLMLLLAGFPVTYY